MTEELVVVNDPQEVRTEKVSCHDLKAANARMKHVLRMFSERKKRSEQQTSSEQPYYDINNINSIFEFIEEEARNIDSLCDLAVRELELLRSDNLKLNLEILGKTSFIIDLQFEKQVLRREVLQLSRIYDGIEERGGKLTLTHGRLGDLMILNESITTCNDVAKRSSGLFSYDAVMMSNENHTKEVSFFYCTTIILIFHFIINQ